MRHLFLGELNESQDITGPCLAPVYDEIGVLCRNLGIANAYTF